jgi:hypothetical protein
MRHKRGWAVLIAAIMLMCVEASSQAHDASISCDRYAAPKHTEELIDGHHYQVSRILIATAPLVIWQILTNYDHLSKVFENMKKCQIVSQKGNEKVIYQEVQPLPPFGTLKCTLNVKEHFPSSIEFQSVGGDMKVDDGFWRLDPVHNGKATLVTFGKYVDMNIPFIKPIILHHLRVIMPKVLITLKIEAEKNSNPNKLSQIQSSSQSR